MTYRFLPHTADTMVAIDAPTLEHLIADATGVMRELVVGESAVRPDSRYRLTRRAADPSELLLGYLQDLLYRFDTDRFVPADVDTIAISPTALDVRVAGETFDPDRHETQPEVKAVTRHALVVEQREGVWHAEVVFDL